MMKEIETIDRKKNEGLKFTAYAVHIERIDECKDRLCMNRPWAEVVEKNPRGNIENHLTSNEDRPRTIWL